MHGFTIAAAVITAVLVAAPAGAATQPTETRCLSERTTTMDVSINVTNFSWPGGPTTIGTELTRVAQAADELGVHTVWVSDHLIQADPTSSPEEAMLEAYSTLGYLAARTERVQLGTMVTAVPFRPPALLVKAVTTLDVLSGGRAWLGVGAGYQQAEADMMGVPMPPVGERFERLDETLRIATQMWSGNDSAFDGTHYQLRRPVSSPPPVRRPHPPILIGGMGERRTLALVAKCADACNLFDIPDGGVTVRRKLDVLARHCERFGRPYSEITKTISTRLDPDESAQRFARRCAALAELGIEHVVVIASAPWTEPGLARLSAAIASP